MPPTPLPPDTQVLKENEEIDLQIRWLDDEGHPAETDGPSTWESDHPEICTAVDVSADGLSCVALPTGGGAVGQATLTCKADADMGAGMVEVSRSIIIDVQHGQASVGVISAGVARPRRT